LSFTLRNVLVGAMLLGLTGGVLGSFALLRRQSLLGDSLAHAALPGVVLAFLITGSKAQPVLLAGALVAGILGSLLILLVTRYTRLKADAAFGIVLSVFFGLGIVLLTLVQKLPGGNQSGLDKFLFGQAAALVQKDLYFMGGLAALALGLVWLFFKEFKLLSFDRDFGASLGFPMRGVEILLTSLLVLAVVLGLQMVGVVLMVATLVVPAAAARQWTDKLGGMVLLAGGIGAAAGALGALASNSFARLPAGPSIVLTASAFFVVSLLFAPRRGLLWSLLRRRATSARIRRENLLKDIYHLGEQRGDFGASFSAPELMGVRGIGGGLLSRLARALQREGLVSADAGGWRLTAAGEAAGADIVRKHRLWELYLSRFLEIPSDHVHRDAEAMEHALSDADVQRLEELLGHPEIDPHGETIPPRRTA
jgi:manganese/zinc/iron transport system permease protein